MRRFDGGRRLAVDVQRPLDEVGVDRLPRGGRDADRVGRVLGLVDRARKDVADPDGRYGERQEAEEQFGDDGGTQTGHGADDRASWFKSGSGSVQSRSARMRESTWPEPSQPLRGLGVEPLRKL